MAYIPLRLNQAMEPTASRRTIQLCMISIRQFAHTKPSDRSQRMKISGESEITLRESNPDVTLEEIENLDEAAFKKF